VDSESESGFNLIRPLTDLQGNILGLLQGKEYDWTTSSDGATFEYFDPYGPLSDTGMSLEDYSDINLATALIKAHGWRGKRQDVTGLIWMGSRYYDSLSGRFISPDPYGHDGSLNLYDYAGGNPVVYCDPDGRFATPFYESMKGSPPQNAFEKLLLNAGAGLGDALSFGATEWVREKIGTNDPIDHESFAYQMGGLASSLRGSPKTGWAAAARSGGSNVGKTLVSTASKGSGVPRAGNTKAQIPETSRAVRRAVMREAGIPTSQQPVSQQSPRTPDWKPAGRQYTYSVPKAKGGSEIKSVQHSLTDRVAGHGRHWEGGSVKLDKNRKVVQDSLKRPRLTNNKVKIEER
jgi:RHS repeat-associated protein